MIRVSDIMEREVVAIPADATLAEVLQTFAEEHISGAPVLGEGGEVLGVISASDLIAVAARESEITMGDVGLGSPDVPAEEYDEEDPAAFFLSPGPFFSLPGNPTRSMPRGPFEGYRVKDVMTAAVFTVSPDEPVADVASFMLRGRIHRVLVTEGGRLRGLVTSFDLLRVLAGEVEDPMDES